MTACRAHAELPSPGIPPATCGLAPATASAETMAIPSALITMTRVTRWLRAQVGDVLIACFGAFLLWRARTVTPQQRRLEALAASASEAMAAIDEVHDLTRLEAEAPLPLHREPTDVAALVEGLVAAQSEASPVPFRLELQAAELIVDGDRARLARVLDNLRQPASRRKPGR